MAGTNDLGKLLKEHDNLPDFLGAFHKKFPGEDPTLAAEYFNVNQSYKKGSGSTISGSGGSDSKVTSIGTFVQQLVEVQSSFKTGVRSEFMEIKNAIDLIYNSSTNNLKSIEDIAATFVNDVLEQAVTYYQNQKELLEAINVETSMTGKLSENFRKEITQSTIFAARLGVSMRDISGAMSKLITDSGRFKLISQETIENIVLTSKVFFDSIEDGVGSLENFQKVSRGAEDAMTAIAKAGKDSLGLGLNAKTTTKTIVQNLEKLNQYGFKNGIEGLTRMVQKAQALRLDLNASFQLADKVMDPTNALSMAANLSVIGGALGDFNDPIKMMWMATNNVEGLQDALVGSAESLVSFNRDAGVFEIVGADLRRAKAMADELGMSVGELQNLAVQSAQRTAAAADLMGSGLIMKEEDKEFLTNIAQMKGGKMVIETKDITGEKMDVELESLSQKQLDVLLAQKDELKNKTMEEIVEGQATTIENVNRNVAYIATAVRVQSGEMLERKIPELIGYDPSKVLVEARNMADKAREVAGVAIGMGETFITAQIEAQNEAKSQKTAQQTTQQTQTSQQSNQQSTVNTTLTILSTVPADFLRRMIESNPELKAQIENSYFNFTNPNK